MKTSNAGFSFVELIVYGALFILLIGMIVAAFTWHRQAQSGTDRLDAIHGLRLAAFKLSDEIAYGTGILHPKPTDANGPSSFQLAFKNRLNEVIVIFLSPSGALCRANMTRKARGRKYLTTLAAHVTDFQVKRPGIWYVEYEVTAEPPARQGPKAPPFVVLESVRIRNVVK